MRFLVSFALVAAACSSTGAAAITEERATDYKPIIVSMSLYIVDDANSDAESPLSSQRQVAEVAEIANRMNTIWSQAGIELSVETVTRISVPGDVLNSLAAGDTSPFLNAAAIGAIAVPDPASINGFYVRSVGRANGVTPVGSRIFFVIDEPSVNDERVSSHEVGHIFGLHHVLDDSMRLMFGGTNGTDLTVLEQSVARYAAEGILDGVR
ncbi:MAG: hypothetical protein IIC71_07500 [Acidobacteria bacterium]|nr:hypothetical protein [Acidobacteriota bacterium]